VTPDEIRRWLISPWHRYLVVIVSVAPFYALALVLFPASAAGGVTGGVIGVAIARWIQDRAILRLSRSERAAVYGVIWSGRASGELLVDHVARDYLAVLAR
jgi:hypothetical protein